MIFYIRKQLWSMGVLLAFTLPVSGTVTAQQKVVGLKFIVDDTVQNIGSHFQVYFIVPNDTIKANIEKDSVRIPELQDSIYDVLFICGSDSLLFDRIPRLVINPGNGTGWKIGIDNRPFNTSLGLLSNDEYNRDTTTKQLYYLMFVPTEDDAIIAVRKKK